MNLIKEIGRKIKNSDKPELNQRPKDNHRTLQSSALPAELLSVYIHFSPNNLKSGTFSSQQKLFNHS